MNGLMGVGLGAAMGSGGITNPNHYDREFFGISMRKGMITVNLIDPCLSGYHQAKITPSVGRRV